jgi:ribosomal protein S12 methylthiotransferase
MSSTIATQPRTDAPAPVKIGMISLGCAKNLVDAEVMLGDATRRGMQVTADAEDADVLVVNTCAFIDSAKEESIDAILHAHEQRGLRKKPGQKLIVSGCMAQRFSNDLASQLSEVDAFIGLDQVSKLGEIVEDLMAAPSPVHDDAWQPLNLVTRNSVFIPDFDTPRFRLTPSHTAYVKIAEGCNHPCSFCVIPRMRGRHRSRTIASVVAEVRNLVAEGVKEINLISQDTTYFGMDLWDERANPTQPVDSSRGPTLSTLLREIQKIEGEFWVRLLYTHPAHWSDELIQTIAECDKVARYIDMPLQHIHEEMLVGMRRETSRKHIEDLIARLRAGIPGLALRTTFIVGFPGETEEHFQSLLDFIEAVRFERLGVFTYSREESSRAAKMPGQIPAKVKQARFKKAMRLQQRIAGEHAAAQVGRTLRVLVEKGDTARSQADAPDVDTQILLTKPARVGEFAEVRIMGTNVYDLVGEPVL